MTPPLIEMRELLKRAADLVDALDHEGLFGDEVAEFYAALEAEQRVGVVPEDCVVVPKEPSDALLRPFYECPPDELGLAWSAMQRIAGKNATLPTLTPQRLAELQANERRWQPIETAPKDGTHILVCRALNADGKPITGDTFGLFVQRAAWWEREGWVVYCSMVRDPGLFFEPTHWMPLPAAPEAAIDASGREG